MRRDRFTSLLRCALAECRCSGSRRAQRDASGHPGRTNRSWTPWPDLERHVIAMEPSIADAEDRAEEITLALARMVKELFAVRSSVGRSRVTLRPPSTLIDFLAT